MCHGYINPYYWVDDHPLLYGNNGSLDPGTFGFGLQDLPEEEKGSYYGLAARPLQFVETAGGSKIVRFGV